MPQQVQSKGLLWIIGLGNPLRRDDGIGSYVISRLSETLGDRHGNRLMACQQLEPDLSESLRDARSIIFVDACMNTSNGGCEWIPLEPDLGDLGYLTHHCKPSFLLGLLKSLFGHDPMSWMVSIRGEDFGLGEGLTPAAKERAERAIEEIAAVLLSAQGGNGHIMRVKVPC